MPAMVSVDMVLMSGKKPPTAVNKIDSDHSLMSAMTSAFDE